LSGIETAQHRAGFAIQLLPAAGYLLILIQLYSINGF
jgi:hypothetical protein